MRSVVGEGMVLESGSDVPEAPSGPSGVGALGALVRWIFVEPERWVHRSVRSVRTPVGQTVRKAVLRPAARGVRAAGRGAREVLATARDRVRQACAGLRRMLFGDSRQPAAVDRREPSGSAARSLGSSTTALTKD
ncbi:hypothetical protein LK07_10930 [Streptomyces pluripotens]|uniref:Uncharacterized protein n=1 Tax=Streptomyces pluripotens TaxID=1355015 RepID=A0A221NWX0_9ACTN|nr:hypothetical protein LK06_009805 [Streptomyces pluripotens]ASN24467.1 hypothetical protein LK07_10930 [Streptomyces pluripotens]